MLTPLGFLDGNGMCHTRDAYVEPTWHPLGIHLGSLFSLLSCQLQELLVPPLPVMEYPSFFPDLPFFFFFLPFSFFFAESFSLSFPFLSSHSDRRWQQTQKPSKKKKKKGSRHYQWLWPPPSSTLPVGGYGRQTSAIIGITNGWLWPPPSWVYIFP